MLGCLGIGGLIFVGAFGLVLAYLGSVEGADADKVWRMGLSSGVLLALGVIATGVWIWLTRHM